ncbi:hypothetical protein GCM10010912_52890 [Paenibacillus albidus]|uniref:Glycosyl hydrolase family 30 TIM-barrel domain-containing protein n=1 Tax=Paenibacillus albidus TaxID=2041023 RepID=A0A917CWG8_9BACL|nr:hypothetical protein GCM10010912_52890 [Paenibacillus albidus]
MKTITKPTPIRLLIASGTIAAVLMLLLMLRYSGQIEPARKVQLWLTTADQSNLLTPKTPLAFAPSEDTQKLTIDVNSEQRYQTMDGFGAAATGSSAYLIKQQLSAEQREQLMKELFTDTGISLSFVRHTIGASDYSVTSDGQPASYTYDDVEEGKDYELEHFSVEKDADVIWLLREIKRKNSQMKLMGTPWSAPAWMKYAGERTLNGWYLDYNDPAVYEAYARYFVKYIQAYEAKGLPIYAMTIQNEPGFTTADYPSMSMGAEE